MPISIRRNAHATARVAADQARPIRVTLARAGRSLGATALLGAIAITAFAAGVAGSAAASEQYDIVIRGGRVIDAASGLDDIRDVGLRGDQIAAISATPLEGERVIEARGLFVSPGFIDLHTHSPTPVGQRYQLLDGVTTALELEAGVHPIQDFGNDLEGRARIHYGASAGWGSARLETMLGVRRTSLIASEPRLTGFRGYWTALKMLFGGSINHVFSQPADERDRARIREMLEASLDGGALGIGVPLDYFSEGTDETELRMIFEIAGERDTLLYIHVRRGVNGDPAGLREALRLAKETGAAVHICHLTHNAMRNTELFLREIREARAEGVDVSTEILPYNAGSALISSAVFGRDFRKIFAIDYEDVEWTATGMRFDEETFEEYREKYPYGQVAHHYLKDEWTRRALEEPDVIIVSDLLPMLDEESGVAPHNGAFSRVLGRYARDAGVLDMKEALARMTLLPAERLAKFFPAFERKGRIAVGADADITIFDPETILDRATYADPFQPSAGIHTVIVGGQVAVANTELVDSVFAGEKILGELATD